jgi:hypothetical protein
MQHHRMDWKESVDRVSYEKWCSLYYTETLFQLTNEMWKWEFPIRLRFKFFPSSGVWEVLEQIILFLENFSKY